MKKAMYLAVVAAAFAVAAVSVEVCPALSLSMIAAMAWAVCRGELWEADDE